jgi:hypothetical protein
MNNEYIINIYVKLIQAGEKQISDIPVNIKTDVENKLNEVSNNVN